ncbi:MAG: hypothetical protein HY324_01110, partial [Chlamydiia bacterium]|nr:hypothetical protein [Chlamydiia bacterium]
MSSLASITQANLNTEIERLDRKTELDIVQGRSQEVAKYAHNRFRNNMLPVFDELLTKIIEKKSPPDEIFQWYSDRINTICVLTKSEVKTFQEMHEKKVMHEKIEHLDRKAEQELQQERSSIIASLALTQFRQNRLPILEELSRKIASNISSDEIFQWYSSSINTLYASTNSGIQVYRKGMHEKIECLERKAEQRLKQKYPLKTSLVLAQFHENMLPIL